VMLTHCSNLRLSFTTLLAPLPARKIDFEPAAFFCWAMLLGWTLGYSFTSVIGCSADG